MQRPVSICEFVQLVKLIVCVSLSKTAGRYSAEAAYLASLDLPVTFFVTTSIA